MIGALVGVVVLLLVANWIIRRSGATDDEPALPSRAAPGGSSLTRKRKTVGFVGEVARFVFRPHLEHVVALGEAVAERLAADPQRFVVDLAVEGDRGLVAFSLKRATTVALVVFTTFFGWPTIVVRGALVSTVKE